MSDGASITPDQPDHGPTAADPPEPAPEGRPVTRAPQDSGEDDLLDGRPLPDGEALELWVRGAWVRGRYAYSEASGRASFCTTAADPSGVLEVQIAVEPYMLFRRPGEASDADELAELLAGEQRRVIAIESILRSTVLQIDRALAQAGETGEAQPGDLLAPFDVLRHTLTDVRYDLARIAAQEG